MFRSFLVIAEVLVLVTILRSPFVQYFLSDIQHTLSDWMTHVATAGERHVMAELREQIMPQLADMRDYQKSYIEGVLSDPHSLVSFRDKYCVQNDKNPFIYGVKLKYVCDVSHDSPVINLAFNNN